MAKMLGRMAIVGVGAMIFAGLVAMGVTFVFHPDKVWGVIIGALIGMVSVNGWLLAFADWIADA